MQFDTSKDIFDFGANLDSEAELANHNELQAEVNKLTDAIKAFEKFALKDKGNRRFIHTGVLHALIAGGLFNPTKMFFFEESFTNAKLGQRIRSQLPNLLQLHQYLIQNNFTSAVRHQMAEGNSSDCYVAAFEANIPMTKHEKKSNMVVDDFIEEMFGYSSKEVATEKSKLIKAIYIERQSLAHLILIEFSPFTKAPKLIHCLRLKGECSDTDVLPQMVENQFVKALAMSSYANYLDVVHKLAVCTIDEGTIDFCANEKELNNLIAGIDPLTHFITTN